MMKQHTLSTGLSFTGKGLHTGRPVSMHLYPAPEGHGIVFRRIDLKGEPLVPALVCNVHKCRRSTALMAGGVKIMTPEHLLSALACLGIDNALVAIDSAEVPILDGSARPYADAIRNAGIMEQDAPRRYIEVKRPFVYEDPGSGSRIAIDPYDGFSAEVTIDFKSKVIGVQSARYDESTDYSIEIAPCRTFCFRKEIVMLRLLGLIKGGSLDNALVVDEPRGYVGDPVLAWPNEPARHKLLDLLGDFSLAGAPIKGKISAYKPGHRINTLALRNFLETNI